MPTPHALADYAWIATRSKALLTTAERATLTTMRNAYVGDPHIVTAIDTLLA